MRRIRLPGPVAALYRCVEELQQAYPGRRFTLDGHLLGSIGEVVAREAFGLDLLPMSSAGHDAVCSNRGNVQIKITAGKSIGIRSACDHLIVLRIETPEEAIVIYDGPGQLAWDAAGKMQKNGQRPLSLSRLIALRSAGVH